MPSATQKIVRQVTIQINLSSEFRFSKKIMTSFNMAKALNGSNLTDIFKLTKKHFYVSKKMSVVTAFSQNIYNIL